MTRASTTARSHRAVLALDGVSPVASAAVARDGALLAAASAGDARSSAVLLALADRVLAEAGVAPAELGGLAAVAGPGSFTGTRVTLATALGLALGTGVRTVAVSTLEALALAAEAADLELLAAVDALRGDWFVQRFAVDGAGECRALEEPRRRRVGERPEAGLGLLVGFGLDALPSDAVPGARRHTPASLAPAVARAAADGRWTWSRAAALRPLYLAPPAVRPTP